ncbi:MAG: aminoacyl--tRNA ligase-related protein [Patescibacteria group bacterium]|nr:aminoacyl--tRNA ligase-related protein [Patescibacteria group bacterium]
MKQSKLFTKVIKEAPKDETSLNAQFLIRAGYIDKLMAGVYTLLPLGLMVYKKIEQIIRDEMNAVGGQEVYMPSLHPIDRWQATGRYDDIDVLFKFKSYYSKIDYVLGPTHEEVVVPLVQKFASSYKDLPVAVYHIQNKFRDEKRAKSGILRGREFMMKDLYSFHTTQKDLDKYYDKVMDSYVRIFERCGIGADTYTTFASGGTFSKYSHEFQTLTESGEDIIHTCDKCKIAVNKEVLTDVKNACPKCGNKDLAEKKAVEVGNIFKLGTKYAKPFNLQFTNKDGKKEYVVMGCYGIGLQRLMGTIAEINNDEKGIIWPENIAPFKVHLLSLNQNKKSAKIYKNLIKAGIEVLYDDREASAGEKFVDSDLIGIPYRLLVSAKTLKENSVEIKKRDSDEVELIKLDEVVNKFTKL